MFFNLHINTHLQCTHHLQLDIRLSDLLQDFSRYRHKTEDELRQYSWQVATLTQLSIISAKLNITHYCDSIVEILFDIVWCMVIATLNMVIARNVSSFRHLWM